MQKSWATAATPSRTVPVGVEVRPLAGSDQPELGRLMWLAFQGSVDESYDARADADADADAAAVFAHRWGPVVWPASFVAFVDSVLISAAVVVLDNAHQGLPLLAFAMTDPAWQRRGIGQRLIEETVRGLDAAGTKELHLAVASANPAVTLYQRLGFAVIP